MNPTVLVVEDDANLREALSDTLALAGYHVKATAHGQEALEALASQSVQLLLSDVQMEPMDGYTLLKQAKTLQPSLPVLLMTAFGSVEHAVTALHEGAADYLIKPFEADDLLARVARYALPLHDTDWVAEDKISRDLMQLAERVADTDATVLIHGESGTGKEVLARFLHQHSARHDKPFVAINCAAIPENMLEATLFGYEKGAFTGAHQAYAGKFEQAHQGTLLLDEISEMDLGLQAKLLRVLQEREVERLGGRKVIALDVRVLATTNRHLREAVQAGRFREDLFYRLNVFPLGLTPLRDRPADVLPLAKQLLQRHCQHWGRAGVQLSDCAQNALLAHHWPGNVRELDNVLQRALILQPGAKITAKDLVIETVAMAPATYPASTVTSPSGTGFNSEEISSEVDLRSHEQRHILGMLAKHRGSRRAAAKELGISERTLRYKIARFREQGIAIPDKLGRNPA